MNPDDHYCPTYGGLITVFALSLTFWTIVIHLTQRRTRTR